MSTTLTSTTLLPRLQALAEETRLEIVRRLARGERCVCELQDILDAGQSRLSFHLKRLKDAGIVTDRREGRWAYYRLVPGALDEVVALLGDLDGAGRGGSGSEGECAVWAGPEEGSGGCCA